MTKTSSIQQMLGLNTYWFGMSFMWNALHPIILPAVLLDFVPDARKNTYLGLLTFIGLVLAMIIQPISGAISDGWSSRFGRRRPLMLIGTLLVCIFLVFINGSSGLIWLGVGYIGLQISSNIVQGPLQGLLRDRVAIKQLGLASSLKVLLDVLSLILAAIVVGRLMDANGNNANAINLVVLPVLLGCAALTILFTPEEPTPNPERIHIIHIPVLRSTDISLYPDYWRLIAERALFLLGIYGVQAFGQYYLRDVLRVADPLKQSGDLLAVIGSGILVLVVLGGWLADRFGSKRILYLSGSLTATGMILMVLATDTRTLTLFASLLGAGIGLFLASNWALANHLAPEIEAGKFLGLTNLATAGSAALARLQGPAVDFLNAARPEEWLGYKGIFVFGALCILGSMFLLTRIRIDA